MTRSDLVEALAARFGQLTHRDAEFAVKTILDAMNDALVRGHRIEIRGFGTFKVRERRARRARNPRSGTEVMVPAKLVPAVNNGYVVMYNDPLFPDAPKGQDFDASGKPS